MSHVKGLQCDSCKDTHLEPYHNIGINQNYIYSFPDGWISVNDGEGNTPLTFCCWSCLKEYASKRTDKELAWDSDKS